MTIKRYDPQTILSFIGTEGQTKLSNAKVLCVGAGGLGSPVLLYLAAAGIGTIGIIDHDKVSLTNLQRQILFREEDLGSSKALSAKRTLEQLNSTLNIQSFDERLTAQNAENLVKEYDIVVDGTDNFSSKFLINDVCVKHNKPMIYGAISECEAQVAVFWKSPCYRCLYPSPPRHFIPNCSENGIIGAVAGIAGSMMALEAIKLILGLEWCNAHLLNPLYKKVWVFDAARMESRILNVTPNTQCKACSSPQTIVLEDFQNSCSIHTIPNESIFLDVREKEELASGMISNAIHFPLSSLLELKEPPSFLQEAPCVVYCKSGVRSSLAVQHLKALGCWTVKNLEGGIENYHSHAGLELVRKRV